MSAGAWGRQPGQAEGGPRRRALTVGVVATSPPQGPPRSRKRRAVPAGGWPHLLGASGNPLPTGSEQECALAPSPGLSGPRCPTGPARHALPGQGRGQLSEAGFLGEVPWGRLVARNPVTRLWHPRPGLLPPVCPPPWPGSQPRLHTKVPPLPTSLGRGFPIKDFHPSRPAVVTWPKAGQASCAAAPASGPCLQPVPARPRGALTCQPFPRDTHAAPGRQRSLPRGPRNLRPFPRDGPRAGGPGWRGLPLGGQPGPGSPVWGGESRGLMVWSRPTGQACSRCHRGSGTLGSRRQALRPGWGRGQDLGDTAT